jgi:hypothetical protein
MSMGSSVLSEVRENHCEMLSMPPHCVSTQARRVEHDNDVLGTNRFCTALYSTMLAWFSSFLLCC